MGLCKRNSVLNVALALNYPNHTTYRYAIYDLVANNNVKSFLQLSPNQSANQSDALNGNKMLTDRNQ